MNLKVKELLEILQKCNPENDISFAMDSGCCGDYEEMEFSDISHYEGDSKIKLPDGTIEHTPYSYPFIRLQSLPGYQSCRQTGATKRNHKKHWLRKNGTYRPTVTVTDVDIKQAIIWATSNSSFGTPNWVEHFERAIGIIQ